jgi:uncharacterized protein YjiS (DUF1127 family)
VRCAASALAYLAVQQQRKRSQPKAFERTDTMTTSAAIRSEGGFFGQMAPLAANLCRAWASRRAFRQTCAKLGALSDRQLDDLGLTRDRINSTAAAAVSAR